MPRRDAAMETKVREGGSGFVTLCRDGNKGKGRCRAALVEGIKVEKVRRWEEDEGGRLGCFVFRKLRRQGIIY